MKVLNILLCIDDFKWDYTRHCAVTILSLLETNKNNKIKFFIISSCLPKENIEELKRIVKLYNQQIEFIIKNDIIPKEIKESVINRRNLTRWTWYRLFFPLYIKNIDRLLYMDCDVIINKDIANFYNMDMQWKAIVGYYDNEIIRYEKRILGTNHYINAGVLLFDVKSFLKTPLKKEKIEEVNDTYSQWLDDSDQDYINIIFKNDILVYNRKINYLIEKPFFNPWINNATIYHCLAKPYIKYSCCPKRIEYLYYHYLHNTKWSDYPKINRSIFWYFYDIIYWVILELVKKLFWIKIAARFHLIGLTVTKKLLFLKNSIKQWKK